MTAALVEQTEHAATLHIPGNRSAAVSSTNGQIVRNYDPVLYFIASNH